jgi:transketolase
VEKEMSETKVLRKRVLELLHYAGDGNIQSIFSALDIIWVLYDKILGLTPDNYQNPDRNFFMLSKGQAVPGLLAVLEQKGFFDPVELNSICSFDSRFSVQADRTKFKGIIETSGGSLGHGLPMAVGIALAAKIAASPSKVFTLVGDGEFNEGTMWESVLLAGHKKLDNLHVIVDDNQSIGKMLDMGNLGEKLSAFGFKVFHVDGHDLTQLERALSMNTEKQPLVIIARTIRGYGSKTLMEDNRWFHRAPNKDELLILCGEVEHFAAGNVSNH